MGRHSKLSLHKKHTYEKDKRHLFTHIARRTTQIQHSRGKNMDHIDQDRLQPNPKQSRIVQSNSSEDSDSSLQYPLNYKNVPMSETDTSSIAEDTTWPIVTYFILFVEF